MEDVHHVVLGLRNSALIQQEIELDIFELWQHHSGYEEEGQGVQDLFMSQSVADQLDVQAEFFVVSHLALGDFVVEFEKSGFLCITFLLMVFSWDWHVEILWFKAFVHEKSGHEE